MWKNEEAKTMIPTEKQRSENDDSDGKTKEQKRSDDSVVGNTSSTSVIVGKFDVFLSFRSIDTGKGFTGFLYDYLVDAGIRTYLDDNELRVGEEIGRELMKAIKESKICIPILSQNYASSKWCLRELARMVECKRSTKENIKPIFYDVEPHDVQNQTGSYEEAFRRHEKDFDEETVKSWKEALKEVGGLKGWELQKDTNGHQPQLVKIVVEEVLLELKKNYMVVTDNLVGIDHHTEEMKRLLNVDSNDVRRIVGIHGIGGIGKTTIAKNVYNELSRYFDCCCFLVDVREMSQQKGGLVNLQKQLTSKIRKGKVPDNANVDEGINTIKGMACNKKVLIVLDDVDEKSQFANLVGERDWSGSRSRIIVTTRDKKVLSDLGVDEMYEPNSMNYDHALQLFSRHAFKSDFPREGYHDLSVKVVSTIGGLPLALEIIGSFMFGKCKEVWEETSKKLRNIPNDQVQKKLRISYEALEYEEKQIFLDIACFFIGNNKTLPFYMWDDCKYYPTSGINILVLRSLVKIGDDNEFRMHDQLRDLGREIVRQENIDDPEERSRLWICKEALDVLDDQTGTKKVKALCLQTYEEFGPKSGEHSFTNDEFGKLPNLRFLRMDDKDLTGDFKNLLLKLRWLQWRPTNDSKPINFQLKNLVILDLSESHITENWEGWSQIKIGKKLKVLDLSNCKGLTRTPDFSKFVSLESLILQCCGNLVEIGPSIGNLINLRVLDISWSGIRKLPDAIGGLEKLEEIYASSCNDFKGVIPSNIGRLSSMRILMLDDTRICSLPMSICGLSRLQTLNLTLGRLETLDLTFGRDFLRSLPELPPSLRSLRLAYYFMETLPSLSNLMNLSDLNLVHCHKLKEIQGLERLESLRNLVTSECESLKRLPDLSNLVMLKRLCLYRCYNLVEVRGLAGLKSLGNLCMRRCTSLERLHDLSNMGILKVLNLSRCENLAEVGGLGVLKSLEVLNMSRCNLFEGLLDLSNLKNLKKLAIRGWKNLTEVQGLEELESLKFLDISDCRMLEKSLDLSNLQKLEKLKAGGCENLPEIRRLEELESLTILDISRCKAIEKLPAIDKLPNLSNTSILTDPVESMLWEEEEGSDSSDDSDSDFDNY